jgi:hypothetical protein
MSKKENIYIAVLVILLIIWAISSFTGGSSKPKTKIDCQTVCYKIGDYKWTFPGVFPMDQNTFETQQECIYACQQRYSKK